MSQRVIGRPAGGEPFSHDFYEARWNKARCQRNAAKNRKPFEDSNGRIGWPAVYQIYPSSVIYFF